MAEVSKRFHRRNDRQSDDEVDHQSGAGVDLQSDDRHQSAVGQLVPQSDAGADETRWGLRNDAVRGDGEDRMEAVDSDVNVYDSDCATRLFCARKDFQSCR